MHETALVLITTNVVLSFGLFWYQSLRLKAEKARGDRYAAAILHSVGEVQASNIVNPDRTPKDTKETTDPLQRPRQIGLTGR